MPRFGSIKLTVSTIQAICEIIKIGATFKCAAEAVGISERSFHLWKKEAELLREGFVSENKDGESVYDLDKIRVASIREKTLLYFIFEIKKATSVFIQRNMALIQVAGKTDWHAAAWSLERRFPDDFGNRAKLNIGGQADNPVQIEHTVKQVVRGLSDSELALLSKMSEERKQIEQG